MNNDDFYRFNSPGLFGKLHDFFRGDQNLRIVVIVISVLVIILSLFISFKDKERDLDFIDPITGEEIIPGQISGEI